MRVCVCVSVGENEGNEYKCALTIKERVRGRKTLPDPPNIIDQMDKETEEGHVQPNSKS